MAEDETAAPAAATAAQAPQMPKLNVLAQYIRDLSFENISAQKGNAQQGKPEYKVQVGLDAKKIADKRFEVAIKLKAEALVAQTPVYILELDYAGQFMIDNVPEPQMHAFLMIECPRMIFPYLRRIVGDVTQDGGFIPLNLDNMDFLSIYRQEIQRRAQAEAANATLS